MKSIYQRAYLDLIAQLAEARRAQGLTQQQVATHLSRPQSFVSKVENGERRLDVIEFLELCRFVRCDPYALMKRAEARLKRQA